MVAQVSECVRSCSAYALLPQLLAWRVRGDDGVRGHSTRSTAAAAAAAAEAEAMLRLASNATFH
jgi:hypothetical protein